jgi:two-component system sensor histidine kinase UhpB
VGHLSVGAGDLAIVSFRVAQEALTNVLRHAGAQHVWIELDQSETVVQLAIRDDGVGFAVASTLEQAAERGRLGLLGMRERVQILGGTLDVDATPGHGTRIRISLPLAGGALEPGGQAE